MSERPGENGESSSFFDEEELHCLSVQSQRSEKQNLYHTV